MLNQPLKPAPSFCVKTHNRILWSSSSTRCFCISSSKTVGEMARHSKLHNKAPPFLRSDLFTRTWKFRRRTWVGCLLRVYLDLHGIYQYNIYIYMCVYVLIYYIHIWLPVITHPIPKRLQPNPMTRNPCKGSEKDCLDFHGETTAQRWERAWQSENGTDLVCVCDANSWATYSRTRGAIFCRHCHWLSLFFCKLEETERGSWFAWQLSILPPSNLKS